MSDGDDLAPEWEAVPPAKIAPEPLFLRGSPERAIRFRRGLIVGAAAVAMIAVVVAAWVALRPHTFRVLADQDRSEVAAAPPADALAKAPTTYADVPQLGPPLPGDLGRPILERQRQLSAETGQGLDQQVAQAAEAERQQRLAELKAARQSPVLVQNASRVAAQSDAAAQPGTTPAMPQAIEPGTGAERVALDPDRDPNTQGRKSAFVGSKDQDSDANPHALTRPLSPYTLSAGSVIAASLITGLRSDLPGLVTAQVTENVYDSATGRLLLIPQGARLIGSYDSVVAFGQRRALVVWQRIILPDGSSLRIDNAPATDAAGYAGLADNVDLHTWSLIKGVALSTLLGVGSELAFTGDGDLIQAIRRSTQDAASRAGDQITSRNLSVQPTITVRPGAIVRLVVHKDLILAPWRGKERPCPS